jgi:hypothetical protein
MSGVTALVNARSLTLVSVVPYDPQPLIPNHFPTERVNSEFHVDDADDFGGLKNGG